MKDRNRPKRCVNTWGSFANSSWPLTIDVRKLFHSWTLIFRECSPRALLPTGCSYHFRRLSFGYRSLPTTPKLILFPPTSSPTFWKELTLLEKIQTIFERRQTSKSLLEVSGRGQSSVKIENSQNSVNEESIAQNPKIGTGILKILSAAETFRSGNNGLEISSWKHFLLIYMTWQIVPNRFIFLPVGRKERQQKKLPGKFLEKGVPHRRRILTTDHRVIDGPGNSYFYARVTMDDGFLPASITEMYSEHVFRRWFPAENSRNRYIFRPGINDSCKGRKSAMWKGFMRDSPRSLRRFSKGDKHTHKKKVEQEFRHRGGGVRRGRKLRIKQQKKYISEKGFGLEN